MAQVAVKSSGVVVPHAPKWYQRLGALIVYLLIRAVTLTIRFKRIDRSEYYEGKEPGPSIYCVWHNRLPLSMYTYFSYIKKRNHSEGLASMVSASKDGGFLVGILECYGVQPIRGSSSRRGAQALRELTSWARRGYDLSITPDGPRGPCYQVQEGIIALAQLTEFAILPVTYNLSWRITLNSWDRFQIPLPFSRCEIIYEKPIRVPRNATESEREVYRQQLEQVLRSISKD